MGQVKVLCPEVTNHTALVHTAFGLPVADRCAASGLPVAGGFAASGLPAAGRFAASGLPVAGRFAAFGLPVAGRFAAFGLPSARRVNRERAKGEKSHCKNQPYGQKLSPEFSP